MEQQMKELIKGLTYSDKVAKDFVKMVNEWKDGLGRPVLTSWEQELDQARQSYILGKISKGQLANKEKRIVKELSRRIQKEISSNEKFFDLANVIKYRQASCLGYSQLVYTLGNSVGLVVKAVVDPITPGPLSAGYTHVACIVKLTDGKTMMVDLALKIVSKPFNYWVFRERRIQILNKNGLLAALYNNRGNIYRLLGQHQKAISDFNIAIELNPKFAEAYANRGIAYAFLGKTKEAKEDFLKAVELNSSLKSDAKKLSDHFKLDLKLDSQSFEITEITTKSNDNSSIHSILWIN